MKPLKVEEAHLTGREALAHIVEDVYDAKRWLGTWIQEFQPNLNTEECNAWVWCAAAGSPLKPL